MKLMSWSTPERLVCVIMGAVAPSLVIACAGAWNCSKSTQGLLLPLYAG